MVSMAPSSELMSRLPFTNSSRSFMPCKPWRLTFLAYSVIPEPLSFTRRTSPVLEDSIAKVHMVAPLCFTTLVTASFRHMLSTFSVIRLMLVRSSSPSSTNSIWAAFKICFTRTSSSSSLVPRISVTNSLTSLSAVLAVWCTSFISICACSGLVVTSLPARSLFNPIRDSFCPSVSCRSRAIR
ncbi:hypothetical protein D3C78_883800 [compost metagenome]